MSDNNHLKKNKLLAFLKSTGLLSIIRNLIQLPKTIAGWTLYNFFPKKRFILILSSMRSGSTLLKALLSQADDIDQIPEVNFEIPYNKYYAYYNLSTLSKKPLIVLKRPSNYSTFKHYPQLPNIDFKAILLIRNPLDTIISLKKMNPHLDENKTDEYLIDYWATTYERLQQISHPHLMTIKYAELVDKPEQVTKEVFQYIGSVQKEGVANYSKPESYKWQWRRDDGGEVIKSLRVQKIKRDYSDQKSLIAELQGNKRINKLVADYHLELPY